MRDPLLELAEQRVEQLRRNAPKRVWETDDAPAPQRRGVRLATGRALVRLGERIAAPAHRAATQ